MEDIAVSGNSTLTKDEQVATSEQPTSRLRWHRAYNGYELGAPVLQQLWEVERYYHTTMYTKRWEEWRDIPEERSV